MDIKVLPCKGINLRFGIPSSLHQSTPSHSIRFQTFSFRTKANTHLLHYRRTEPSTVMFLASACYGIKKAVDNHKASKVSKAFQDPEIVHDEKRRPGKDSPLSSNRPPPQDSTPDNAYSRGSDKLRVPPSNNLSRAEGATYRTSQGYFDPSSSPFPRQYEEGHEFGRSPTSIPNPREVRAQGGMR